jgi:hypothetical protein
MTGFAVNTRAFHYAYASKHDAVSFTRGSRMLIKNNMTSLISAKVKLRCRLVYRVHTVHA